MDELLVGHLSHEVLHGDFPVGDAEEAEDPLGRLALRIGIFAGSGGFGLAGDGFPLAGGGEALEVAHGMDRGEGAEGDAGFGQRPDEGGFLGIAHRGADVEAVVAGFEQVGALFDAAQIVEGGHEGGIDGQLEVDGLAGGEQGRFFKGAERAGGLAEAALGGLDIGLDDLAAGAGAGIFDPHRELDFSILFAAGEGGDGEGGVGQAEAEGIVDARGGALNGFEIAVADEDILVVFDVVVRLVEGGGGGIVVEGAGEGIGELAGGVDIAAEDIGFGEAAFGAGLPGEEGGADLLVVGEPIGIDHAADVEHDDDAIEGGCDLLDQAALGGGDGSVAAFGAFGQLKPLGGVEDDEAGAAGLAEQFLQDHAELGDVGVGPPGLGVQDGLQVQVPHVLELLLADGGADVAVVLLVIQAQALGCDAGGNFVGLHPLLEPLLHGGLPAGGKLPPLQGDDEVGQLLAGLLLRLAPDLVAAAVPGDRLANIRVLFHQ